jgi:hypothetical protein
MACRAVEADSGGTAVGDQIAGMAREEIDRDIAGDTKASLRRWWRRLPLAFDANRYSIGTRSGSAGA